MVEPGQIVSPGSGALYRIAAGGQMEIRAQVAEQDMHGLAAGRWRPLRRWAPATAMPARSGLLEPLIDPDNRQGVARIMLPQASELRAGGFANVVVDGAQAQRPRLPQSAVPDDRDGTFVLTVGADNIVKRTTVTTGPITPEGVVFTGLNGSEKIKPVGRRLPASGRKGDAEAGDAGPTGGIRPPAAPAASKAG